jgi:hypothetical protein
MLLSFFMMGLSGLARTQAAVAYTTLLEYNFETANNHNSNTESYGVASVSGISGNFVTTHANGSAGIEGAGSGAGSSFNRYSGTSTLLNAGGVPIAYFTLTAPMAIDALTFDQWSNHNFSYTQPSYNVNVDFGTKSGGTYSWANAGSFLAKTGGWTSETISLRSVISGDVGAGDYALRFVAQTSSTQSDFLALDNVKLVSNVPEPSALSLLAVGLGLVLRQRRRTV